MKRANASALPILAAALLFAVALVFPQYSAAQAAPPGIVAVTPGQISTTPYKAGAAPSSITSVAEDPSGNVYVLDSGLGTLTEYPLTGSPLVLIAPGGAVTMSHPSAMVYSSIYQQLFITDTGNNRLITVFLSPSGASVVPITPFLSLPAGSPTSLNGPTGIFVGGIGANVYVADTGNQRVLEFGSDGDFISVVAQNPIAGSTNSSTLIAYPVGVAVDRNGLVYIANLPSLAATSGGNILRVVSGATSTFLTAGLQAPYGLTMDAADDLYFSDVGTHLVSREDILGDVVVVAGNGSATDSGDQGPATAAGLSSPLWLALDPSNRILIPEGAVVREVDVTTGVANFAGAGTQSLLLTNPTDNSSAPQVGFEFQPLVGADPGDYTFAATSSCQPSPYGNYLSPSASCTLDVIFTPVGSGPRAASLPFLANYDATAGVFSATGAVTQTILLNGTGSSAPAPTTTSLTFSPVTPAASGASVTITSTTVVAATGTPVTEGSVTFTDGSVTLAGSVPVASGGTASFSTSALAVGTHIITATYTDTANEFATSASAQYLFSVLPNIMSLSLNPTTVTGGATATATVTLSGPAPAGGALITLSASPAAVATAPANITIPSGTSSVTFTVTTSAVTVPATATIIASYDGTSASATLTITPAVAPSTLTIPTIVENITTTDSLGSNSTLISATVISPIVENITTTDSLGSNSTLISATVIAPITENITTTDTVSAITPLITVGLLPTNPYTINLGAGTYVVNVSLLNGGNVPISELTLLKASLGGLGALSFPSGTTLSNLAPGAIASFTATFSTAAGAASKDVPLSFSGTYAGGTLGGNWSVTLRSVTLP
jgi:Bacterial Ig-like domain (group 3)